MSENNLMTIHNRVIGRSQLTEESLFSMSRASTESRESEFNSSYFSVLNEFRTLCISTFVPPITTEEEDGTVNSNTVNEQIDEKNDWLVGPEPPFKRTMGTDHASRRHNSNPMFNVVGIQQKTSISKTVRESISTYLKYLYDFGERFQCISSEVMEKYPLSKTTENCIRIAYKIIVLIEGHIPWITKVFQSHQSGNEPVPHTDSPHKSQFIGASEHTEYTRLWMQ